MADPAVRVVIDTSLMAGVYYDSKMGAFAIEAGARLGEAYRTAVPGLGGHDSRGCVAQCGNRRARSGRRLRVLVSAARIGGGSSVRRRGGRGGRTGTAKSVVATREPADPNRDLWWAHTGGGGGNFGVVTRYWFRSPDAEGTEPASLLPKAPDSVLTFRAEWKWQDVDQAPSLGWSATTGTGANGTAGRALAPLSCTARSPWAPRHGTVEITGLTTAGTEADRLLDEHLAAIDEGVGLAYTHDRNRKSWLAHALDPAPGLAGVNWSMRSSSSRMLSCASGTPTGRSRSPTST